jgi:hypothetical protein
MQRVNFTLDEATIQLLEKLSERLYSGNKSQTVRSALESLAVHSAHGGWVIAGYAPVALDHATRCHTCGDAYPKGNVLYRPVFQRGEGPGVLPRLPAENWLDCGACVEQATRDAATAPGANG